MITAPLETITMQVPELRHLFDRSEATWRRALAERVADLEDGEFAESPEITQAIGASAERIEAALDDLFLLRAVYIFEAARDEVPVSVEDLLNLLLETDFR